MDQLCIRVFMRVSSVQSVDIDSRISRSAPTAVATNAPIVSLSISISSVATEVIFVDDRQRAQFQQPVKRVFKVLPVLIVL